jgi:threonine aldolase
MLGGGMRQAGIIAACGLHALERHLGRIAEDHVAARELADALARGLDSRYRVQAPETNILLVEARDEAAAKELMEKGHRRGVLALAIDPRTVRYVTHLDLPPGAAAEAARRIAG